ncbi:MAG: response regulator [Treponema sp.]|nr:response regulator [Treponema sp.]
MDHNLSILIVEDERLISMMLRQMLEKAGFTVCGIAPNLKKAYEVINSTNPDFALIDIHLEDGDNGIELGKILNKEKNIPFAYVTAYSDSNTYEDAKNTKPIAFLHKPVSIETIKTTIKEALVKLPE